MYDSIRDVTQQEIFNSYRGILRISPNYIAEKGVDNTEDLYIKNKTKIRLSDSAGDLFDIHFYSKTFNCSVVDSINVNRNTDLINMVHYYNVLRINKNLNIKSTLSCDKLVAIEGEDLLIYPTDCPYDSAYCNISDELGIGNDISSENIENKFSTPDLATKLKGKYTQVEVDGQLVWRKSNTGSKIPEVYRHDYILGHSSGGTYGVDNRETQLSFISLDKMIWEKLTAALNGVGNNRHYRGRYNKLGVAGDESIANKIFNSNDIPTNKAPILGIPVQSGLIMYSAMPIERYYFHLNNADITNDPADTYVYNLITEYALCDGKALKKSNGTTDYNKISVTSKNWSNFSINNANSETSTYSQIHKSMKGVTPSDNNLYTPALFEKDQMSPRYLRGLNWKPLDYSENNTAMSKTKGGTINNDKGNNIKNLHDVGPYLANHDYKIRKIADHQHHCLTNQNAVPKLNASGSYDDSLRSSGDWLSGKDVGRSGITPRIDTYSNYKNNSTNKPTQFRNTNILQVKKGQINKEMQDIPIAMAGGSRSRTCSVGYGWKGASCIKIPLNGKVCHNHKNHNNRGGYAPGFFQFKGVAGNGNAWKTISSVNKHFIVYGVAEADDPTVTTKYSLAGNTKLDDTLSFPATFNFLPLIKI